MFRGVKLHPKPGASASLTQCENQVSEYKNMGLLYKLYVCDSETTLGQRGISCSISDHNVGGEFKVRQL